MKDILREPVELIDSDLDEVAGGFLNVNAGNSVVQNGVQGFGNVALLITGATFNMQQKGGMGGPS